MKYVGINILIVSFLSGYETLQILQQGKQGMNREIIYTRYDNKNKHFWSNIYQQWELKYAKY